MSRLLSETSDLRKVVFVTPPIASPSPIYQRWTGYGYGNSLSSNTVQKNFSNDGYTYQLGELRFEATPINYGSITLKKNDDVLLSHYGDIAFYWQARSTNSWYFTYPDSIKLVISFPAGVTRYFIRFASFYRQ